MCFSCLGVVSLAAAVGAVGRACRGETWRGPEHRQGPSSVWAEAAEGCCYRLASDGNRVVRPVVRSQCPGYQLTDRGVLTAAGSFVESDGLDGRGPQFAEDW